MTQVGPFVLFALAYVTFGAAGSYASNLLELNSVLLDIALETVTFGIAALIGGYWLKKQQPDQTKRDRHRFALGAVTITWALLIAIIVAESLSDSFQTLRDSFAQIETASLGFAVAATVVFVGALMSVAYYLVARLILNFVAPLNRIVVQ